MQTSARAAVLPLHGHEAQAEAQDWLRFAEASTDRGEPSSNPHSDPRSTQRIDNAAELQRHAGSWLALATRHAGPARTALLLLSELPGQPYAAVAAWPDPQRDLSALAPLAERALREGCGLATTADGGSPRPGHAARLAFPVSVDGRVVAVVLLELADGTPTTVEAAMRALHWASGWLIALLRGRAQQRQQQQLAAIGLLHEATTLALAQRRLDASALAVANLLAERFGASRVVLGLERGGQCVPLAVSHSAGADPRSDLLRQVSEAMDEVLDAGIALWAHAAAPNAAAPPPAAGTAPGAPPGHHAQADGAPPGHHTEADGAPPALAHPAALQRLGLGALLSVPLRDGPHTLGAITLMRQAAQPFSADQRALLLQLGDTLAPLLARQQALQAPLRVQLRGHLAQRLEALRRPGPLLLAGTAVLALGLAAVWPMTHRVSAPTRIEGLQQRAVSVPFDAFLADSLVRPGDTVQAGQPLARLDDRALRLEQARTQSERDQQLRRVQIAMAQGDRAATGVAGAQLRQAEAALALADDRLAQATLRAPIAGVVLSGDLHGQLGTAVATGRVLFELAPAQGHRVVLQVPDADIGRITPGQRGELVLASLPARHWAFTVHQLTPLATHTEGRNLFRVEALLDAPDARLRPGMEGVGKVQVGERSALWLASHGLVDWLRLAFWRLAP